MKPILMTVFLLITFNVLAQEPYTNLYNDSNYQEYLSNLIEESEKDNHYAQNELAETYQDSDNPNMDLSQAVYWYEKAAENGNANAALQLGSLYGAGVGGLEQDCEMSVYWLTKATKGFLSGIAWNNVAWTLVTCPDEKFIDAKRALEIMQEHGEEFAQTAGALDTLAAIHAQLGDFVKAVVLQETALFLIEKEENKPRIESMNERLKSYKSKKAWVGFAHSNPEDYIDH
jgi:hypothetical protein